MRKLGTVASAVVAFLVLSQPAGACMMAAPLDVRDVKFAEMVVIGRVSDYRIVRDMEFRRQMLANPRLSPESRAVYESPDGSLITDYARFDVLVEEVLVGKPTDRIAVTWYNSTFGVPKTMEPGPFLIAVRSPGSGMPPLRGPSATIMPNKEPGTLTLLQAPCSGAFIFPVGSPVAADTRKVLKGEGPASAASPRAQ